MCKVYFYSYMLQGNNLVLVENNCNFDIIQYIY